MFIPVKPAALFYSWLHSYNNNNNAVMAVINRQFQTQKSIRTHDHRPHVCPDRRNSHGNKTGRHSAGTEATDLITGRQRQCFSFYIRHISIPRLSHCKDFANIIFQNLTPLNPTSVFSKARVHPTRHYGLNPKESSLMCFPVVRPKHFFWDPPLRD